MRRGLRRAWVVSALAHALLVALLFRARPWRRSDSEVASPSPVFEVEVEVEVERRSVNEAPPGEPPDERVRGPRRRATAPRESAPAPPRASGEVREGDEVDGPAPALPEQPPGKTPELSLDALSAGARARLAGPPPEATLEARPRRPSVDALQAEIERAEDAVANVAGGRVDPLLYDYLRGARARFEEEARRLADQIAMGPGATVRSWGRGYLERVEQVHRKGAGVDEGGPDLSDEAARRRPDVIAGLGEATRQAAAGAEQRRVEICLDVAPGREPKAVLRRGSGNVALDRVALESFAGSAAVRPVPPDARAGRACYEVRIAAYRAPPLPFLSCGLGRDGVTCVWPFKKVTSVTGRLLSVEYPPAPAAARSLLRKAR